MIILSNNFDKRGTVGEEGNYKEFKVLHNEEVCTF
jgi:hypothetical protein